jgi:hypothetical protein
MNVFSLLFIVTSLSTPRPLWGAPKPVPIVVQMEKRIQTCNAELVTLVSFDPDAPPDSKFEEKLKECSKLLGELLQLRYGVTQRP